MKSKSSPLSKKGELIYKKVKKSEKNSVTLLGLRDCLLYLCYLEKKLNFVIIELFTDLKVIIHMTIVAMLKPQLQELDESNKVKNEGYMTSAHVLITFFKKYKHLCRNIASHLDDDTVSDPVLCLMA